jgi:hypothetical protein
MLYNSQRYFAFLWTSLNFRNEFVGDGYKKNLRYKYFVILSSNFRVNKVPAEIYAKKNKKFKGLKVICHTLCSTFGLRKSLQHIAAIFIFNM